MSDGGGLTVWQALAGIHLLMSLAVYLPSAVAALMRRAQKPRLEVRREDLQITEC